MPAIMKVARQKVQKDTESWIEPDPIVQPPGTTGYPIGTPPPQKLLPKLKRRQAHSGFNSLPVPAEKISSQLIALSRRNSLARETRSKSAESEDTSKSADDSDARQGKDVQFFSPKNAKSKSQTPSNASGTPRESGQSASPDIQQDSHESAQNQLLMNLQTNLTNSLTTTSSIRKSLTSTNNRKEEEETFVPKRLYTPAQEHELDSRAQLNGRRGKRQTGILAAKRMRSTSFLEESPPPPSGRNKRQKKQNFSQYVTAYVEITGLLTRNLEEMAF